MNSCLNKVKLCPRKVEAVCDCSSPTVSCMNMYFRTKTGFEDSLKYFVSIRLLVHIFIVKDFSLLLCCPQNLPPSANSE